MIGVIGECSGRSWVAVMQDAIVNWFALRRVSIDYFGATRPLLGALHQPQRLRPRSTAVLLCNPFGEEASRSHRIYRVLATQLERAGYAALRFDYSGTGDSAGEARDATIDAWLDDIATAAERLRTVSGASKIAVVGLRLGATLAMLASARGLAVRHAVLWDPVVEGAAYVRELVAQHRSYMRAEIGDDWRDRLVISPAGIPDEALGAPISDALGAQLTAIDLAAPGHAFAAEAITVITTRTTPDVERLRPRLPASARWIEKAESAAWNNDAALNAATVPMDIVQAVIARIEEVSP
jgi:pimeloyl-ACP methyl ester carboxylesterase